MNNTNFKISSPFLSCFNNLSGLYFEALVSRFWRGLVGSKFLLFHGSEEESVYSGQVIRQTEQSGDSFHGRINVA